MSAYGGNDVQEKLYDLEEEERRIHAELAAMEDELAAMEGGPPPPAAAAPRAARAALNALLAECEREVRQVKGYVKENTQPLQIVRLVPGMKVPKSSTFLSRPKDTGVDFTVPVVLPDYLAVVKQPVFLNDVRDKCKRAEYGSAEDYLEDMRLLARNTAAYNKGESLGWVVQHARLLLEAAEDAVSKRRKQLIASEAAARAETTAAAGRSLPSPNASVTGQLPPPGKRRRSGGGGGGAAGGGAKGGAGTAADGSHRVPPPPPPGAASTQAPSGSVVAGNRLFVLWPDDMSWYSARVVKKTSVHRAEVEYDFDQTRQTVDLRVEKWRPMLASAVARLKKGEPPTKRHKGPAGAIAAGSASHGVAGAGMLVGGGVTKADLDEVTEAWSANLDAVRASLLSEIHQRFDRIERSMQRSDPMMRVLLLVHELSDVVADSTNRLEESIGGIEKRIGGKGGGGGGLEASAATAGNTREGLVVEGEEEEEGEEGEGAGAAGEHGDGEKKADDTKGQSPVVEAKDDAGDEENELAAKNQELSADVHAADAADDAGSADAADVTSAALDEKAANDERRLEKADGDLDSKKGDDIEKPTTVEQEDAEMTAGENEAEEKKETVDEKSADDTQDAVRSDDSPPKDPETVKMSDVDDDAKSRIAEEENDVEKGKMDAEARAEVSNADVELKSTESKGLAEPSQDEEPVKVDSSDSDDGKLAEGDRAVTPAMDRDSDGENVAKPEREASEEEPSVEEEVAKNTSPALDKASAEKKEASDSTESRRKGTEDLSTDPGAKGSVPDEKEKTESDDEEQDDPVPMEDGSTSPLAKTSGETVSAEKIVPTVNSGERSGDDSDSSSSGSDSSHEDEREPMKP